MRKIISITLLLIICLLCLVSCTEQVQNNVDESNTIDSEKRFIVIYEHSYNGFKVYVDTETNVQYLRDSTMDSVYWTMLVDSNGNPLLYKEIEE